MYAQVAIWVPDFSSCDIKTKNESSGKVISSNMMIFYLLFSVFSTESMVPTKGKIPARYI
jgi:hypothetical protein